MKKEEIEEKMRRMREAKAKKQQGQQSPQETQQEMTSEEKKDKSIIALGDQRIVSYHLLVTLQEIRDVLNEQNKILFGFWKDLTNGEETEENETED